MTRDEAIDRGLNTARGVFNGVMLCASFWLLLTVIIWGIL